MHARVMQCETRVAFCAGDKPELVDSSRPTSDGVGYNGWRSGSGSNSGRGEDDAIVDGERVGSAASPSC